MKIVYVPSGKQIHLNGDLPQDEFDWLESLQGQCHRADPILKCSRCDGALYVRHGKNNADSLLAVHFTQGSCEDIRIIRPGMSPDHRHEAEYYAQAAEQAGYRAQFEVKTVAETRVDVVIEGGPVRVGLEVQRSGLSVGAALERTRRTSSVGVTVAWSANSPKPPLWYDRVPSFRPTLRMWQNVPAPRSVGVAGPVIIKPAKCVIGAFDKCPAGHRRPCGQYHPRTEPWLGLLADDIAALLPAGEMIAVILGKHTRLTLPASVRVYEELTGVDASKRPGSPAPGASERHPAHFECTRPSADGGASKSPDPLVFLPFVNTRWNSFCARCHAEPPGPGGILCPKCRIAIEAQNRSMWS